MNAQASDKDVNNEHVLDSAPAKALILAKCSSTKQTIQIAFQKMQRKAIKLQMGKKKRKISFCSVKKCENFNFIVIYVHMPMDALFCGNRLKLSLRLK